MSASDATATTNWTLKGDVLENCSCEVVCPGHFNFRNQCTHEYCRAAWAFETTGGRRGEVPLEGLRVVVMGEAPKIMIEGDWTIAVYVDQRASEAQTRALDDIFSGRLGGPWAVLDRFVGRRLPTRRVEIRAERHPESGRLSRVEIPDVLVAEVEPIRGHDKKNETLLVNLYNTLYQSPHVVARGTLAYHDHGIDWPAPEHPGHGILTTFDWTVAA